MTKLFFVLAILCLSACRKEGDVTGRGSKDIKINGKEYYFIRVVPEDGETGVWLLIPRDSKVEIPEHTSYQVSCGKNCHYKLCAIWIKS